MVHHLVAYHFVKINLLFLKLAVYPSFFKSEHHLNTSTGLIASFENKNIAELLVVSFGE